MYRPALLGLLLCLIVAVSCRGNDGSIVYLPTSNYLGINLQVTPDPTVPASSFTADPLVLSLDPLQSAQLRAFAIQIGTFAPAEITYFVDWTQTNPDAVIINENGLIVGVNPGNTVITASLDGGLTSQTLFVHVTGDPLVSPPPVILTGVVIRNGNGTPITSTLSVPKDGSLQLQAVGRYSDGSFGPVSGVVWKLSDPTKAQISAAGELLPLGITGPLTVNARVGALESNYILVQITN